MTPYLDLLGRKLYLHRARLHHHGRLQRHALRLASQPPPVVPRSRDQLQLGAGVVVLGDVRGLEGPVAEEPGQAGQGVAGHGGAGEAFQGARREEEFGGGGGGGREAEDAGLAGRV